MQWNSLRLFSLKFEMNCNCICYITSFLFYFSGHVFITETDLKESAVTGDNGKTKNKKKIEGNEDNSVEADETTLVPDTPMEENVSGELFDRDSNENESENENSPEHHVIVEPVDGMSFDEIDLDTSSQGTFYDEEILFPSVGPPQMLEFLRENHSHVVLNSLEKIDNSS